MRTFKISGFFHGPLSERRQPPWSAQLVHVPPKKSGNWLQMPKNMRRATLRNINVSNKQDWKMWFPPLSPGIYDFKQLVLVFISKNLSQTPETERTLSYNKLSTKHNWDSRWKEVWITWIFVAVLGSMKFFTVFHSNLKPGPALMINIWCSVCNEETHRLLAKTT